MRHFGGFCALMLWSVLVFADGLSSPPLYEATFQGLSGQMVSLRSLQGKVAVVNFWASWCAPCRRETPDLVALEKKFSVHGANFIGIAVEDEAEVVRRFLKTYGVEYPVVLGREPAIALMQKLDNPIAGLPFTLVLDETGAILLRRRGVVHVEEMERTLRQALAHGAAGP